MKTLATVMATITDVVLVVVISYGLWLWTFSGGLTESVQQFYIHLMLATTVVIFFTVGVGILAAIKVKT